MGSVPGQGTKVLHAQKYGQKKKKKELLSNINWYEVTVFSFPSVAFTEISSVSVGVVVIVLFSGKLSLKS